MMPWEPSALVNHLWQSTLVVFAVWLAVRLLRHNAARVRCWLWTAASVKFLLPLSLLVSLGEQYQWRSAPAAAQPAVLFVMEDVLAPADVIAVVPASVPPSAPVWPWLLPAVWCAGAVVVLISWRRQWLPIRAAMRRATPVKLAAQYDAGDLDVLSSPSMPEPAVVGIRRPRLVLPEGILERLTPAQARALIAHERCHIRCRDNLTAAIHMAVEAIFWFHPAVWWIESRLIDERERACDEAVLQSGSQPGDYAEGILEVCRQSVGLRLACVSGVSGSNLRARVEAIMRNEIGRPLTRGRRLALAVAVIAAVAGPVAGGSLAIQSQVVVPPAGLAFESASITSADPRRGPIPPALAMEGGYLKGGMSRSQDGRFNAESPVHVLIQAAYNVSSIQVAGGPSWVALDRYEIHATAAGNRTPDQMRGMLQSLLADRFKLALRRETRTLPVYELVVANDGLKIAAMKAGGCIPPKQVRWDLLDWEAPRYFCDALGRRTLSQNPETRPRPRWPRVTRFEGGNISMAALIDAISGEAGRVVIDKTGFTPRFNLVLDFASAADPTASGPTIFAAVEDQLGLRLAPAEAPVDVLVIDRVERP